MFVMEVCLPACCELEESWSKLLKFLAVAAPASSFPKNLETKSLVRALLQGSFPAALKGGASLKEA